MTNDSSPYDVMCKAMYRFHTVIVLKYALPHVLFCIASTNDDVTTTFSTQTLLRQNKIFPPVSDKPSHNGWHLPESAFHSLLYWWMYYNVSSWIRMTLIWRHMWRNNYFLEVNWLINVINTVRYNWWCT